MNETVNLITHMIESREPHQIITANPIMVMSAVDSSAYMQLLQAADLVVPDGAGIVWAANYVGNPVAERVTGFDLLHRMMQLGESKGWKVYLLGASPEMIEAAASSLKRQYPALQLVGYRDGYFQADEDAAVIANIREHDPDILLIGRSADKQEPWIAQYKQQLRVPVIMGVGGSFDVLSGKLKRAPVIFQRLRLEWFYRLLQEPWRYKRMLVLPKFAMKVIREKKNVQNMGK
ncbi:WecB/TagA/CpsF family glycosyltransferase [Paenibacillus sp. WQ 127069]|uniref:N-acetylglucosaminyldiphosphoundecaprenol N-acetyl-beta-D-mannosaminyltransferase n=1 Tax=Paenibacillus baimaensis TaxID=2982185 RepID=A0ABT2UEA4_9BACL|nr:WecB/TagA/CpsF family glycosyltransferase [Paenibacillus sp. WQ 127069]MCU6792961.1 WecB/TagA/CpsF family glycosyltransferase [Paenibacillus sp. WQ 127069]